MIGGIYVILTITLNPSIDRRYNIDKIEKGKIFRTDNYQYTIGGKGLNVTKVIKTLDEPVIATGFLGGSSGDYIDKGLNNMDISHRFIKIDEETRSCLAVICSDGNQMEILERGPSISEDEIAEFLNLYEKLLEKADIICASGSIPYGVPLEIYGDMINLAKKKDKKFILDTSGEALRFGIDAGPYLVKPNKKELEDLTGIKIDSNEQLIRAAKDLSNEDIEIVVVSLGEEGAMAVHKDDVYKVIIPSIRALNPIGSGDSMIAGFAVAINRNYDFETMLKVGAACGTANAMESETGKVNKNNVDRIMEKILIEKLT
nr:1-phosphofructokinase [Tissierella carlieri]